MKKYILLAKNSKGENVYIDDVPNGKKCNCVCAECGEKLVAKQGHIRAHHFAHENGNEGEKCAQTALHLLAKSIIFDEGLIPKINGKLQLEFAKAYKIEIEKNLGDIIPDVFALYYDEKEVAVEILVTHAVDKEKYKKIRKRKLTTFEIDLSKISYKTKDDVKNAVYNLENIKLIYDEKITALLEERQKHYEENCIEQKRQIIMENGTLKTVTGGRVSQCPMKCRIIGNRIVKMFDGDFSKCKVCPFSYIIKDSKNFYCMGNINGKIPNWFLQANVNENRFMTGEETKNQIEKFKNL